MENIAVSRNRNQGAMNWFHLETEQFKDSVTAQHTHAIAVIEHPPSTRSCGAMEGVNVNKPLSLALSNLAGQMGDNLKADS